MAIIAPERGPAASAIPRLMEPLNSGCNNSHNRSGSPARALRPTQAGGLNFAVGGARLDPLSGPHELRQICSSQCASHPDARSTLSMAEAMIY
jgi:hypothetical protein